MTRKSGQADVIRNKLNIPTKSCGVVQTTVQSEGFASVFFYTFRLISDGIIVITNFKKYTIQIKKVYMTLLLLRF